MAREITNLSDIVEWWKSPKAEDQMKVFHKQRSKSEREVEKMKCTKMTDQLQVFPLGFLSNTLKTSEIPMIFYVQCHSYILYYLNQK